MQIRSFQEVAFETFWLSNRGSADELQLKKPEGVLAANGHL